MAQPTMQSIQTKNLDSYNCSLIESISSDYGPHHPPPPPDHYYDTKQHHEPLPNIQILGHNRPKKRLKSTPNHRRSITPPPHPSIDTPPSLKPSKSVSAVLNHISHNGTYTHASPPLTANIAEIEQALNTTHSIKPPLLYNSQNRSDDTKHTNAQTESPQNNSPMNKDNASSILSIESLEYDRHKRMLLTSQNKDKEDDDKEESIDSIHTASDTNDQDKTPNKKPKIRMWNVLAYGLEDPVEGQTFEWMDSKYVRLLQLSTYSTVMGPKVKFVWKNSQIYQQNAYDVHREEDAKTEEPILRPEFAYHELEAWIAKQTLDCTGWKSRHNKTAPPPFIKKTMIVPEFGVVLSCIQFDSSLRALRNKQFNQYIHGIYAHNINTKANKTTQKNEHSQRTPDGSSRSRASNLNHPIPSSKSYSSRYSSPVSSYRPVGDTLADYLSKCAPFSFSAGMAGGMNVSGANVPQVPFNYAMLNQTQSLDNSIQPPNTAIHAYLDDNEDPDDIGHYSLVLAVEYKHNEKFIECLDGIEHWLYTIATQIRYLLALNKCFKCDQMDHSIHESLNDSNDRASMHSFDEDCPDRLHTIIPFMTNIVPTAIFKFDQLFSATHIHDESEYMSRGLPQQLSLFDTWFTWSLDNRDKHRISTMISSHLQTLGRTVIVGDNEEEIDRYISTLALFSTSQQRSLSRLSVKADNPYNLCSHYIPELYLQGIVIPNMDQYAAESEYDTTDTQYTDTEHDVNATVTYLQSSSAIKQLQEDLYLAPGPSTLILLTTSTDQTQSFWWIRQTAMPHKFKQEQQGLLFQRLFYLKRRRRGHSASSCIYARRRSGGPLFDTSPSRKDKDKKQTKQMDHEPIHAPHSHYSDHHVLTFVEPSLSPMIATIVFGSFNIPQPLKMTFLETQFRILLQKASEILLYIEHEQKELLAFYDKTCHVMSCKDFKAQVPMEALYPQIMQKFESQLRSDLQIPRHEDLYVLLSISEGFRPNLFSLMFGNPVFDIEVADILRYFLF